MKEFKVLGTGCKKCLITADRIAAKAKEFGVEVSIEKVTEMADIMKYGIMSTPGVVLDGTVVHAGGIPSSGDIRQWLKSD